MVEIISGHQEHFWLLGETLIRRGLCSQKKICMIIWITVIISVIAATILIITGTQNQMTWSRFSSVPINEFNNKSNTTTILDSAKSSILPRNLTIAILKEALKKAREDFGKQQKLEDILIKKGQFLSPETSAYVHHKIAGNISKFSEIVSKARLLENVLRNVKDSVASNIEYSENTPFLEAFAIPLENCTENFINCLGDGVYRALDGSCNNLKNPSWGMIGTILSRLLGPTYDDGISSIRKSLDRSPLPSARLVSSSIHQMRYSPISKYSHMMMAWGQFIAYDITKTAPTEISTGHEVPSCCQHDLVLHSECLSITISTGDAFYSRFNQTCMEFVRSSQGSKSSCIPRPREQLNLVTSFIDGSTIYGSSEEEMKQLRSFQNGMLRNTFFRHEIYLPIDDKNCVNDSDDVCYLSGDTRVNEQPLLTSLHTLWLREHNRLASSIKNMNPHWTDEKIFQEARKIIGAMIQHITYTEFLPYLLGPKVTETFKLNLKREGFFDEYDENLPPSVLNEFASAAFRFGHSMVQGLWQVKNHHDIKPLKELYFNSRLIQEGHMSDLLTGALDQNAKDINRFITPQLTNYLFQSKYESFGLDLAAINIQRGRDHGLPSYNQWREKCHLHRFHSIDELKDIMDDEAVASFKQLYKNIEDIDLYPAGLAEKPLKDAMVGPTFACLIGTQFARLRFGDRFWYENGNFNNSFTSDQLSEIRRSSLMQIICDNMREMNKIQFFPMLRADQRNPKISCNSRRVPRMDLSKWAEID